MDAVINPMPLHGTVSVPPSKSMGHRVLIAAALAKGTSRIRNHGGGEDLQATMEVLTAFGARFSREGDILRVSGGLKPLSGPLTVNAAESASTLRFLMPVGLLLGQPVTWEGEGRLPARPLSAYVQLWKEKGISCSSPHLPLTLSGTLKPGTYRLPGNESSQYFSGLLMALPLLDGPSELVGGAELESAPYVEMTRKILASSGIVSEEKEPGHFLIPGGQSYRPGEFTIEGDYSAAAFWMNAGLLGGGIRLRSLPERSVQGDEAIVSLLRGMGAGIAREGKDWVISPSETKGRLIHAENVPDLVPPLAALAAVSEGTTVIDGAGRLRLKECDRLHSLVSELGRLGGDVEEKPEGLVIHGKRRLSGGTVSSWHDHRTAMALASVASRCEKPVVIRDAECVRKSDPLFWARWRKAGGQVKLVGKEGEFL